MDDKVKKFFALLGSDNENEALAALRKLKLSVGNWNVFTETIFKNIKTTSPVSPPTSSTTASSKASEEDIRNRWDDIFRPNKAYQAYYTYDYVNNFKSGNNSKGNRIYFWDIPTGGTIYASSHEELVRSVAEHKKEAQRQEEKRQAEREAIEKINKIFEDAKKREQSQKIKKAMDEAPPYDIHDWYESKYDDLNSTNAADVNKSQEEARVKAKIKLHKRNEEKLKDLNLGSGEGSRKWWKGM